MLTKKILCTAIAAAGCCVTANNALADSLGEICGTKIGKNENVGMFCGGGFETLTANCNIKLDKGANLTLNACNVNADGYSIEIKGEKDADLTLGGSNGSITNASKITFNLSGQDGSCDTAGDIIDIANYDLAADSGDDGTIDIKVSCGDIDVDLSFEDGIFAEKYVNIQADKGNVHIQGFSPPNPVGSGVNGALYVTAGAHGVVDIVATDLSAGGIMISSGGGSSMVTD